MEGTTIKLSSFRFFFRDSVNNIKRNTVMSIASILSVVSALVIVGIIFIVAINVNYLTQQIEDSLELKVYLSNGITDLQKESIYNTLLTNDYVATITYESKEEAMSNFKEQLEGYDYLLEGYSDNNIPLPDSYIVTLTDPEQINAISEQMSLQEGVRDVVYGKDTVDSLLKFNRLVTTISWVVFSILSLIAIFIIYNTIKLTVFSRRTDISIMKYVGATDWYIRFPFIIEGSLLGVVGSLVSILLIRNLYYYLYGTLQNSISVLPLGTMIAPPGLVMIQIGIYFILYGVMLGAIGSMFSIRKFLNV